MSLISNNKRPLNQGNGEKAAAQRASKRQCLNGSFPNDQTGVSNVSKQISALQKMIAENEKALATFQRQNDGNAQLGPRVSLPNTPPSYPQPSQQMSPTMEQILPQPEITPYSTISPPDQTISNKHAEDPHNQGRHFDYLIAIEEVLDKNPENLEALILKITTSDDLSPTDYLAGIELLFIQIKELIKERKWDESLKIATLVLKILPEEQYKPIQAMALAYQAKAYRHLGRMDEFRNCITEALAKDPANKLALKQQFNEFLDFANSILANDPKNKLALKSKTDALTSIIGLLVEQKKTKKALAKIELMLSFNPNPLFAMMKEVYDLKEQNQLADAQKIGNEALRACSNLLTVYMSRQTVLEYQSIQAIWVHIMDQLQDGNEGDGAA